MAQVAEQSYELVDVGRLTEHPRNPRRGDVGLIAESIEANGFYGAVVAQRSTGFVLAGNHRLRAAVDEGLGTVPVIWVDVDDERAETILAVDNRANDQAAYDEEALLTLLRGLPVLTGSGYSAVDLAELAARVEPSFEPVGADRQGQFDRTDPVTCPNCGYEFVPGPR